MKFFAHLKKTAIIMLLLIIPPCFSGQALDDEINALQNQLTSRSGKEKVRILLKLAKKLSKKSLPKSLEQCSQALGLAKKNNWQLLVAESLNAMGVIEWSNQKFDSALKCFLESLDISRVLQNDPTTADSLAYIGMVYSSLGHFDKALKNFLDSLQKYQQIEDMMSIANILNNIGFLYSKKNNFKKSLQYYVESLKIIEKNGEKKDLIFLYNNIGRVYLNLKKPNQALPYYQKSLEISQEIEDITGIIYSLNNLGKAYIEIRNYNQARQSLNRSLKISLETKTKRYLPETYENLSELYIAKDDYKTAYGYLKSYIKVTNAILNEETTQQIAEMQEKYDSERKKSEIESLQKDNRIKTITRDAFTGGFILVFIILILLFKKYLYLFAFWKKQKYIGQYRLLEKIGSGGVGTVFSAHNVRDKTELVAIKILREETSEDDTIRKRFKQEASIIEKLNHPHIVKIIERGEYKDKLYIVMERLGGKTLDRMITEEPEIPLTICVSIMKQMLEALKFIHGKNIIHRDLKPANVMLIERDGNRNFVKLLDFGLAKHKFNTTLTKEGELIGTIGYLPPEQLLDSEITSASDIYSMGMICYELITGEKAFLIEEGVKMIKQVLDELPPAPVRVRSNIPRELSSLVMQMISKDPLPRPDADKTLQTLYKINHLLL